MPNIQDIMDSIGVFQWVKIINFSMGYYSMGLDDFMVKFGKLYLLIPENARSTRRTGH